MNQQYQVQRDGAYETAVLERLRELYLTHTPLPMRAGGALTLSDFYRCYRYIKAEGYGGDQPQAARQRTPGHSWPRTGAGPRPSASTRSARNDMRKLIIKEAT
jgi:hypothetical protein